MPDPADLRRYVRASENARVWKERADAVARRWITHRQNDIANAHPDWPWAQIRQTALFDFTDALDREQQGVAA